MPRIQTSFHRELMVRSIFEREPYQNRFFTL